MLEASTLMQEPSEGWFCDAEKQTNPSMSQMMIIIIIRRAAGLEEGGGETLEGYHRQLVSSMEQGALSGSYVLSAFGRK